MIDSWTKTIRNFSRNSPKPNIETRAWDQDMGRRGSRRDRTRNPSDTQKETVDSRHSRRPPFPVPPRQRAQPSERGRGGEYQPRVATAIVGRPCQIVQRGTVVGDLTVYSPLCEPRPKILQLNDAVERRTEAPCSTGYITQPEDALPWTMLAPQEPRIAAITVSCVCACPCPSPQPFSYARSLLRSCEWGYGVFVDHPCSSPARSPCSQINPCAWRCALHKDPISDLDEKALYP